MRTAIAEYDRIRRNEEAVASLQKKSRNIKNKLRRSQSASIGHVADINVQLVDASGHMTTPSHSPIRSPRTSPRRRSASPDPQFRSSGILDASMFR